MTPDTGRLMKDFYNVNIVTLVAAYSLCDAVIDCKSTPQFCVHCASDAFVVQPCTYNQHNGIKAAVLAHH